MFLLFLTVFFFKVIPVPVENIEGIKNKNKFISGGFYWTSLYQELYLNNYSGVMAFCLALVTIQGAILNKW